MSASPTAGGAVFMAASKALAIWNEKDDQDLKAAGKEPIPLDQKEVVKIICSTPPVDRMDNSLNQLTNCKHLSLSTNCIDRMIALPGLKNIQILSLARNQIKKIQGLDEIGATLKELWLSYNQISTLDGLQNCTALTTLYVTNNKIKSWDEVKKLNQLPSITSISLYNNPVYEGYTKKTVRPVFGTHCPKIRTLDGEMLTSEDVATPTEEATVAS